MEAWAWLVAYLLGFGLLQLVLYRYFQREFRHADTTPATTERSAAPAHDGGGEPAGEGIHCPECGCRNLQEPTFTYCRRCTSPLQ